jgi:uncharacterized protein (DUF58 family)
VSQGLEQRVERWLGALDLRLALGGAAVIVFLIAWNRGIALLYGMFWLLVAALAVGYVAPRFNLGGIDARRTHPARGREGDRLDLALTLSVPGRRPRYMVEVYDRLPFATEAHREPVGLVPRLKGEAQLRFSVECDLRGLHRVGPLRVRSAYPLGIGAVERELPDTAAEVLVYPRPFSIFWLPLLGSTQVPILGTRAASVTGGNDEVFGVREYRRGDSPRHVHWAASARRGELVVKEYEYIHCTDVLILLDLNREAEYGEGKHSTLEYAVKIAASIAQFALDEGHGVGLLGFGRETVEVPVARGPGHFREVLEVLARVRADGERPYPQAVRHATARMGQGGVLVLFEVPGLDGAGRGERIDLYQHHVKALRVRFDSASFHYPLRRADARKDPNERSEGYFVRRGDDLERLFARR